MTKKISGIDPKLKKAVADLLAEVMKKGSVATLTDKMKVIDRGLKLAAIEAKLDTSEFGSGLIDDDAEG